MGACTQVFIQSALETCLCKNGGDEKFISEDKRLKSWAQFAQPRFLGLKYSN